MFISPLGYWVQHVDKIGICCQEFDVDNFVQSQISRGNLAYACVSNKN